jgi:hypothetical protein
VGPVLRRIVREPLLHYLALGGLLFAASIGREAAQRKEGRRIILDDALVHRLATDYRQQTGRPPNERQIEDLLADYVRDEVRYREAVALGLDPVDPTAKRRLGERLDALQQRPLPEPTEDELKAFRAGRGHDFDTPARASFVHVYFAIAEGGPEAARSRALGARPGVERAPLSQAASRGDRFPLPSEYSGLDHAAALRLFGAKPMTEALFTAPVRRWIGPVESAYGFHLVFLRDRQEAVVPGWENVRDGVLAAWKDDATREAARARYEEQLKRYEIVRRYRLEP